MWHEDRSPFRGTGLDEATRAEGMWYRDEMIERLLHRQIEYSISIELLSGTLWNRSRP